MKQLNKQILEAVNRGINLALDGFEDSSDIQSQTHGIIKNDYTTNDYLTWCEIIEEFEKQLKSDNYIFFNSNKFNVLNYISRKIGIKYNNFTNSTELRNIIKLVCKIDRFANLNWIDVSHLKDLINVFRETIFCGNISNWNISNMESLYSCFELSEFNGDISNWDVSNVTDMSWMFNNSVFNKPIGNWNVSNVKCAYGMFGDSQFNQDISNWDLQAAIKNNKVTDIFENCPIKNNYKPEIFRDDLNESTIIPLTIKDNEELPHFKDEWYPTIKDWNIMIKNMNNHSALYNIFNKIKDVNKLVRYYLIAKALYWPGIDDYYENNIYQQFLHFDLTFDEIHLIENENSIGLIPEEINDLLQNLEEYDKLGGVALRNQDLGVFVDNQILFKSLSDIHDIQDIKFMRLPIDYENYHKNIRIIEINFLNGSKSYFKITELNKNCYHLKTYHSEMRNISKSNLYSRIYILLHEYTSDKIVDGEYTPNWL